MNTYIGTKIIRATPMTRQAYNDFRGWTLPADEDGNDEGYLVEYMDGGKPNTGAYAGYVSWSPKAQFDDAYTEVGKIQAGLAPHEVRVLAEQAALQRNIRKLQAFISSQAFGKVEPAAQHLLVQQANAMLGYSQILGLRINAFLVSDDDFELPAKACDLSGEGACEACQ